MKMIAYRLYIGNPEERNHYKDLDVGGRISLRWIWRAVVNTVMNYPVP
jgi:hypothetical protein